MQIHSAGRMVRGLLSSGDLSTATAVTWYDQTTQEVVTLGTNHRVIIYLIAISNGDSAVTVTVFDDADADGTVDAGETIVAKSCAAKDFVGFRYDRGFPLVRTPKVKSSGASANTSITILAEIQE